MRLIDNITRRVRFAALPLATLLAGTFASCDSVIYDYEGDCDYYVHFTYDYNMKRADAFPHEVRSVTLCLSDSEGRVVWSKTESGEALSRAGYAMRVDVDPGLYDMTAWCGVADPTSFRIPQSATRQGLTATLAREYDSEKRAHVRGEVDRLYYGRLDGQTLGHDRYHFTVPLMKDTNDIRVVLQHLSGELVPDDMFTYTITDCNGALDWDNRPLEDDVLTYHAWHVGSGVADIVPPQDAVQDRTRTAFSTAVAEFTVSRLMKEHAPDARLVIRRADTGETVIDINLIDALLLVKGHYNREMSDQEYLDRQDEYALTFFLDEGFRWIDTYIYVNSWLVVRQDTGI